MKKYDPLTLHLKGQDQIHNKLLKTKYFMGWQHNFKESELDFESSLIIQHLIAANLRNKL